MLMTDEVMENPQEFRIAENFPFCTGISSRSETEPSTAGSLVVVALQPVMRDWGLSPYYAHFVT